MPSCGVMVKRDAWKLRLVGVRVLCCGSVGFHLMLGDKLGTASPPPPALSLSPRFTAIAARLHRRASRRIHRIVCSRRIHRTLASPPLVPRVLVARALAPSVSYSARPPSLHPTPGVLHCSRLASLPTAVLPGECSRLAVPCLRPSLAFLPRVLLPALHCSILPLQQQSTYYEYEVILLIFYCSLRSSSPAAEAAGPGGPVFVVVLLPRATPSGSSSSSASFATRFGEFQQIPVLSDSIWLILTRMDPLINLSCAALVRDDNSPATSALPVDSGARIGEVKRVTKETNVSVKINLDGCGVADSSTGIPFLDHMLDQLASHGLFDVHVKATGDTHIDDHHTNEDVALAIGTALLQALGDRKGINRFGDFSAPLDEALIHVSLDLSGRPHLGYNLDIPTQRVGTYDTQLVEHFFQSLVNTSGMTLHIRQLAGKNSHHIIEATFKAFARALRQATEYDPRRRGTIPSSKGVLSRS
ncbi:hypothetical protein AHAS_Ahas01G0008600 [Arachis hypogaea]